MTAQRTRTTAGRICRICNGPGTTVIIKLPGVRESFVHEKCRKRFEEGYTRRCNTCGELCKSSDDCQTDEIGHLMHITCHEKSNSKPTKMMIVKSVRIEDSRTTISDDLDKFSVGRIGTFRNWRSRRFVADRFGIEYFKGSSQRGRVSFTPSTRLRLACTSKHHPRAVGSTAFYLLISFREIDENRTMLIRTTSSSTYDKWASFLSQHIIAVGDSDSEGASECSLSDTYRSVSYSDVL